MKRITSNSSDVSTDIQAPSITNEWSNVFIFDFISPIKSEKLNIVESKIKYDKSPSRPSQSLIETDKYCHLINNKNQIDVFKNIDKIYLWSRWSKLINPYEKIGSFSNLKTEFSISRAFYKLYEIMYYFDYPRKKIKTSLHLCEAPGGFISASLHLFPNLDWKAQTLYEGGGCLKVDSGLNPSNWIHNGNGDITLVPNILELENKLGKKVDLITADGGFDVSHDPNNQEQLSLKLIFGETLAALHCQKVGGSFICKIFDSMTRPTYQLLLILSKYYDSVKLTKPRTSRYTNSEKYIVALGFKGITDVELNQLDCILYNWNLQFIRDFGIDCKKSKYPQFVTYNTFLAVNQSWYIHQAVHHSKKNQSRIANNLETMQNKRALVFCLAFDLREGEEMCKHTNTNKVKGKGGMKFLFKCEDCLQVMIKLK